jgi:hypothetical protein
LVSSPVSNKILIYYSIKITVMKINTTLFTLIGISILTTSASFSQSREQDYSVLNKELTSWDPIRGEWLASSIIAMSKKEQIPDRNFPENVTPFEMLKLVPEKNIETIRIATSSGQTNSRDSIEQNQWGTLHQIITSIDCKPLSGRTYGDPHITTYDGNSYSLQTVGEYILSKSENKQFEVQTRHKANGDDFSLNTACAMNVSGDRVAIYATDFPDKDQSTPLRVNGNPVYTVGSTYFLAHGGTVRNSGKEYFITWPTGEKVIIHMRGNSNFPFMDVTTQILPCQQAQIMGLLGNANNNKNDDLNTPNESGRIAGNVFSTIFDVNSNNQTQEQKYLKELANTVGTYWRVTHQNTLFDYPIGQSTTSFTDLSFPRFHRTINEIPNDRRELARRDCEAMGVSSDNLRACIFDKGFLDIPPTPKPIIVNETDGRDLPVITPETAKPNINTSAAQGVSPKPTVGTTAPNTSMESAGKVDKTMPVIGTTTPKPIVTQKETKENLEINTTPEAPLPITTTNSKETGNQNNTQQTKTTNTSSKPSTYTPKPIESKPKPVSKPIVKPVIKSTPKPKPTSKPKPVISTPKPAKTTPKPTTETTPVKGRG